MCAKKVNLISDGTVQWTWDAPDGVCACAYSRNLDEFFVSDSENNCVWLVGPDVEPEVFYKGDKLANPRGICCNGNTLFIEDDSWGLRGVKVDSMATHRIIGNAGLGTWGLYRRYRQERVRRNGLCFHPAGPCLFLSLAESHRVIMVTFDSQVTTVMGTGTPGFKVATISSMDMLSSPAARRALVTERCSWRTRQNRRSRQPI